MFKYVERGVPMGDFLTAVFANDLCDSFGRADEENQEALGHIAAWVWNRAPKSCWGSRDKVKAWIEQGGWLGQGVPLEAVHRALTGK